MSFLLLVAISTNSFGQASVNESLEKSVIYVDNTSGSDGAAGTKSAPFKTVGAAVNQAVNNNRKGIGTRIVINAGTYRESISLGHGSGSTNAPLTLEAATNGTVYISGAELMTGWVQYSENNEIYTQRWSYHWGTCGGSSGTPVKQDIMLRQEVLAVNGTQLTEVLSLSAMRPGTFFPDEAVGTLYVWPPSGTNMSTADVEVAVRPSLFIDHGAPNVVLRGLIFEYANSCRQSAAVTFNNSGSNNILIDSDKFIRNNGIGLAFTGAQNFTVQYSTANHNGQMGFYTGQVKHGMWDSDTASYNNWRGGQGAYYSYDTGGAKFMHDHNGTFKNLIADFNQTHPLHFDTDNANFTVDSLTAVGNVNGFLVEKSQGPGTVSNTYLCRNTPFGQSYQGGITILDSTSLTFSGNYVFGNGTNEINFLGNSGGSHITNWETGQAYQLITKNLTLNKNIFAGSSSVQLVRDSSLGGSEWNQLISTLHSSQNTWWAAGNSTAFTVPSPKYEKVGFSQWQNLTGQDTSSKWASVTTPVGCNVEARRADYFLVTQTIAPVTVSAGQAQFSLATVSLGGMKGTIDLTVDGVSSIRGASASFSKQTVNTDDVSTLTVTTKSSTPAGTYPITVVANSGNLTHTVTVSLVVN